MSICLKVFLKRTFTELPASNKNAFDDALINGHGNNKKIITVSISCSLSRSKLTNVMYNVDEFHFRIRDVMFISFLLSCQDFFLVSLLKSLFVETLSMNSFSSPFLIVFLIAFSTHYVILFHDDELCEIGNILIYCAFQVGKTFFWALQNTRRFNLL